jgi:ATP/maltotriose-dependent transcriptional regulator MalT
MENEARGGALIGREQACAVLRRAAVARPGQGNVLLVTGEAGVGKTALIQHAFGRSDLLLLSGAAYDGIVLPYGPLVAVLRAFQQVYDHPPTAPTVARALALLAPDRTASSPGSTSSAALFDALHVALAAIARLRPVVVFLDDLQWADNATLELLPALSGALAHEALLVTGAYRNDEIPRDHAIRRMRSALRRAGRLHEISLAPLDRTQTAQLIMRALGAPPSAALTAALYDRTEGLPFFIEELALALLQAGRLSPGQTGFDLDLHGVGALPLPESVRDAVLLRTGALPAAARRALEITAVAGKECATELITTLAGEESGIAEILMRGLIVERAPGRVTFRHALVRDVCYAETPWPRRRAVHRQVAAYLESAAAPAALVAEHWLAGHDPERARPALLAAAEDSCSVHAYRDATRAYQRALEVWPEGAGDEAARRLNALERLGHCAELAGDLVAAMSAWREVADCRRQAGMPRGVATAEHRLAGIYERQGNWEQALEARDSAAAAFAASGDLGDAAAERLMAAAHLRSAAIFYPALALLDTARAEAERAGRLDLQARILGLEGNVRARLGQSTQGLELVRAGLALALEHNVIDAATDIYQRLADTLEHAGDYAGAQTAYDTAAAFCQTHQAPATAHLCRACLTVVLRLTGDWERAMRVSRAVLASPETSPHARAVAAGVLGSLHILRGQARPARPLLLEAAALARRIELAAMEIDSAWCLAMLDDLTGAHAAALARCRALIERWERTEERHYVVTALRWAITFCAEHDGADEARMCAAALARIATASGHVEALSALAHALGETALLDGDAHGAAVQFDQALALLQGRPLPLERAQSARRAGIALLRAGERDAGVDRLVSAYRTARHLGARPLAARIAQDLAGQGEPVERRLGRRTGGHFQHGGLSRRELEVLRLITTGHTSREIAATLFLSPRTVEMHVDHLLAKLDCRTRAEAARKAMTLGLLA